MIKTKGYKFLISLIMAFTLLFTGFSYHSGRLMKASAMETKNEKTWCYEDCEAIMIFINDNFERFVDEYNQTVSNEEALNAEYIEYSSIIWLVEDENYGGFIDFNGSNGYLVLTVDYNIYEIENQGDFEYLRTSDELYYSYLDGFLYEDENGLLQTYDNEIAEGANAQAQINAVKSYSVDKRGSSTAYPGQTTAGDGEIDPGKITEYVTARYPDYKYETKVDNLVSGFNYSLQYHTSYYVKLLTDKDGNPTSPYPWTEGNCVLNALYMVMDSWRANGFVKNLPTTNTDLRSTITSDPLYSYYGMGIVRAGESGGKTSKTGSSSGSSSGVYHKWQTNDPYYLRYMPTLYTNIRNYAVSQYGYSPEVDFAFDKAPVIGEYVANTLYGNAINIEKSSSVSSALNNISNKAVFLGINNSSTYGNHGVAIVGYYKYSYKSGWWIFSSTKYAYFYEIADGWNSSAQFFDPNTSAKPSMWAYYLV